MNHSLLADPYVRRVLDIVAAGGAGEPLGAEYFCSSVSAPWGDGPPPPHYGAGGNPFRDLGVHGLYLLRAVLGEIEAVEPAFASRGGDPNLCFDEWAVLVRCARGFGHIRLSWTARPLQTVFTVHTTGGTLRADIGSMFVTTRRPTPLPRALDRAAGALQEGAAGIVVGAGQRRALVCRPHPSLRGGATRSWASSTPRSPPTRHCPRRSRTAAA